jgi:heavy metal sensor kinase
MFKSIRARIAFGYTAVWAIILISCAVGTYALGRHQLYREIDGDLSSGVNVIALSLTHEIEEHGEKATGEAEFRGIIGNIHQRSFPEEAILIFDGARLVAEKNGDAEISLAALARMQYKGDAVLSSGVAGTPVRIAHRQLWLPQVRTTYTVVMSAPLHSVDLALSSLRNGLLILVPLAILLCSAAGYYLARESLRPVVEIANAVDRLTSRNLSESLPVLHSEDELGHLGKTFNRLLGRLHKALEQQRQFMADASHELRTPLSIALVTAQVALERDRDGAEYRQALETVKKQTERLSRMVQDMFLLARSDTDENGAGGYSLRPRHCDLAEILMDAVSAGRMLGEQKGVRIKLPEFAEAPINADPALLQQLILILLDNAIKASDAGTRIAFTLREDGDLYRLRIQDQGHGIPVELRGRIFDRFFRVEKARSPSTGGGAGLGLAIARWIAALHQGEVELIGSSEQGSTFEVRLPRHPAPTAPDREKRSGLSVPV